MSPLQTHRPAREFSKGITLVELVIVVAVIAILVGLAVPTYQHFVRKANRGEAQQLLMNWANNQEIWRANNTAYAGTDDLPAPTHDRYAFTIADVGTTTFTLTATATGDQANDAQEGTSCSPLTLDEQGDKTPAVCW